MNMLWAMGLLAVVSLCLPACDRELEVQQAYDFTLETIPSSELVALLGPAIPFATFKARVRGC